MNGSAFGANVLFFACAALVGCREPTQITVEITTDEACSPALRTGIFTGAEPASRTETGDCNEPQRIGSIVLVPSQTNDRVYLTVATRMDGKAPDDCFKGASDACIIARRTIQYVSHKSLTLPIAMRNECLGVTCDNNKDLTCMLGRCRTAIVGDPAYCDESTCAAGPVEDGGLPSLDAGPVDAGPIVPKCRPGAGLVTIATRATLPKLTGNGNLAFDANYVYWADETSPTKPTIERASLDGDPTKRTTLATVTKAGPVAVLGSMVAWGGLATIHVLDAAGTHAPASAPFRIVASPSTFFFTSGVPAIESVSVTNNGLVVTPLRATDQPLFGLALDDTSYYWLQANGSDPSKRDVLKASLAFNSPSITVASQQDMLGLDLAQDNLSIYWTTKTAVMTAIKSGSPKLGVIVSGLDNAVSVAVDRGTVYWSTRGDTTNGEVWGRPLSASPVRIAGPYNPVTLAIHDGCLYWADDITHSIIAVAE